MKAKRVTKVVADLVPRRAVTRQHTISHIASLTRLMCLSLIQHPSMSKATGRLAKAMVFKGKKEWGSQAIASICHKSLCQLQDSLMCMCCH